MNEILSTPERKRILEFIIDKVDSFGVNSTSSSTGVSKALVSKYLKILERHNIVQKVNGNYHIKNSPITKGIKILIKLENIPVDIFSKYDCVNAVGIYGSAAKGEYTSESDTDIWIYVERIDEEQLASLSSELRNYISNISILNLTSDKLMQLKEKDKVFYYSLVFGSIIIYGDIDDIQI